jgi:predicted acetyltransferase
MSHPLLHRTARAGDLDRLIEIHLAAFPDPRPPEVRKRNFLHNALGPLEDLHVVERDGALVAHAFLFRLEVWFGGRRVQVGAIASVGVAPEARGQGVGTALLGQLHHASNARGDALTMLYPFRQGYYARLGYAPVTPTRRLALAPEAIPRGWEAEPGVVRAMDRGDRAGVVAAYTRAAARTTGWIRRPDALWDHLLVDERRRWSVLERGGKIAGYLHWGLEQAEPHARTDLVVHELAADDPTARRRLLGMLGAMRDQVATVVLETDADDALDRALVDPDRGRHGTMAVEHPLGEITAGPMVRVEDTIRALESRGYDESREGRFVLGIEGEDSVAVEAQAGSVRATPTDQPAGLILSKPALAALLFGGLRVLDAFQLGWLEVRDEDAAELADALFAHPPFFAIDRF